MDSNVNFKYYAFISYSHEDTEFAQLIQKKLTEYKLPSVIRKANPLLPSNVRPIFRDATNLTTGMLQGTLHSELEHSKFLIVLCSPNSARPNDENKHWVNKEVKHFIELGRAEFIIPVIVGGEPHATNPAEECFCPALLSLPGGDELLGIDIRDGKKKRLPFGKALKRKLGIPDEDDLEEKATVHIVAKMLGLGVDDLWNWDKKARKRKAYARLSTIATLFIVMLTAGLFVYFKKFHVYHEYYVDYVERAVEKEKGIDIEFIGLGKLSKKDIKSRYRHYKFDFRDGKLRRIVHENSVGVSKNIETIEYMNRPMIQEIEYNESTGYLQAIVSKNEYDSILMKYVYEQKGSVIDLKNKDGTPVGLKAQTTSLIGIGNFEADSANIKSLKIERDENGYIRKKMYFKVHGAEYPAKDADGISGFEYELDNYGRPIQIWYLGMKGDLFVRQSAKNGVAGYLLEYDEEYNISKTVYVDSLKHPVYNNSFDSGVIICVDNYEKGNLIKQSYYDEDGILYQNSNGVAYNVLEYDNRGNQICISHYDKDGNYAYTDDFYAIERFAYDKRGNLIESRVYDTNNELCMAKSGFSILRIKYNRENKPVEATFYDTEEKLTFCSDGYAKISISYTENGDVDSRFFFDDKEKPCFCSDGYARVTYTYNENHQVIKISYYDIDFMIPVQNNNGYAYLTYEYNKLGNITESKKFDELGSPTNGCDGICCIKFDYNESGNLKEKFFYDLDGNSVKNDAGYVGFEMVYDEFGNIITESFYKDAYKSLCDTKDGYAYIEYKYDDRGNQVYEKKYNSVKEALTPICITRYKYDKNNNIVWVAFFDKEGNFVKQNGYAQKKIEYSNDGKFIKESYFDETGNYALFDNSYSIAIVRCDRYRRPIELAYYDANGVLNNMSAPYVIQKAKYDSRGNRTELSFYKNQTELCLNERGYAVERVKYDRYNKPIRLSYYDEKSEPTNAFVDYNFFSYVEYDCNRYYKPTFYDRNGKKLEQYNLARVSEVYPDTQACGSEIVSNDILLSWNNWKYNSLNPDWNLLSGVVDSSRNTDKILVLYNPKKDKVYYCRFGSGDVGIHIVDWTGVIAGFQESFSSYRVTIAIPYKQE